MYTYGVSIVLSCAKKQSVNLISIYLAVLKACHVIRAQLKTHGHMYQILHLFGIPMSAFATLLRKSFYCKLTAKINFAIGHFMFPLLMLTLPLHTLFDKYLDYMPVKFEQNPMVDPINLKRKLTVHVSLTLLSVKIKIFSRLTGL